MMSLIDGENDKLSDNYSWPSVKIWNKEIEDKKNIYLLEGEENEWLVVSIN